MKRTKRLSFLVALIIAITNIAFIGIPSVGAEGSEFIVSDDFENYTAVLQDGEAATLESMQELCDMNPWWYSVKSTVFNKAADVGAKTPLIASVVSDGNNNALRLTYHAEAGVGTNIATPTQANQFVYGNGSYEVSFKFKTTDDVRIYGVGGKQENETATFYHHNILTKSGDDTYMGDTEASSPAGQKGTDIVVDTWYTIKVVVNNGLGYYSVEVADENGASLKRVGGINFKDGCPAISNIRFQATSADSVVYIDDYTVKQVTPDNLLYEDDFNNYSGFSGGVGTYTVGANLFKEISQLRVQDKNSKILLGVSGSNKYLGLNAQKYNDDTHYPANAMYMPWNGYILTKNSQEVRGKLQLNFSFNIANVDANSGAVPYFKVICADSFNASNIANLANDKYTMFSVRGNDGGSSFGIDKTKDGDSNISYAPINKGKWYDVRLTFDLINNMVRLEAVQQGTTEKLTVERSTGLYNGGNAFNAIKSIMFKAVDGMQVYIDNVELKYVPEALQLGNVKVKDFNGASVTSFENVNPALSSIEIPFNCPVTDDSVKNIKLMSEDGKTFTGYTATNVNGVYTMSFAKTLAPNTKYQLIIPTTVESVAGTTLAAQKNYDFTTGSGNGAEMVIADVSVKTVEEITNGSTISITTKYANTKDTTADYMAIVAFYDADNRMIGSSYVPGSISARSISMEFVAPVKVPAAEELDLSKVNKVSIYLWDSYGNIRPYCESVDILKTTTDSE